MSKDLFFKSVYEEFWNLVNEYRINLPGQYLSYEDYPGQSKDMIYGMQEVDSTRELLNTIHQFSTSLNKLTLWNEIISKYGDMEQKIDLYHEFINHLVYYCLHQPYEFKSRLIFLATQLCYTEGLGKQLIKRNEIEGDEEININSLKKVVKHWQKGQILLEAIKKIDGKDFREKTKDYRRRSQHRVPPQIDHGIKVKWVRSFPESDPKSNRICYALGQESPLEIVELIPPLVSELQLMINSFKVFRCLIDEHTMHKPS